MNEQPTNPTNSTPPPAVPAGKHMHWRGKASLALVVLIVVACVGAAVYYSQRSNGNKPSKVNKTVLPTPASIKANESKGLYSYTYSGKLDAYTVAGKTAGQGFSFNKPIEFTGLGSGAAIQAVQLSDNINKAGTVQPFGQIAASSSPYGGAVPASYTASLTATLSNPANPGYQATLKPLEDFVQSSIGSNYKLTYAAAATNFNADYITANAWSITFTGEPLKSIKDLVQPSIKGQAVMAVGGSTFYYFMVNAPNSNWTSNQALWKSVFNSLKIDQ